MYARKIRNIISTIILCGHFLLIGIAFIFFLLDGFTFAEFTTTLAIVIPLTSIYTSAVVKKILSEQKNTAVDETIWSKSFGILSISLCGVFLIYLFTIIVLKATNTRIDNFEQFKALLLAGETIFGVYIGQVIQSIFGNFPQGVRRR